MYGVKESSQLGIDEARKMSSGVVSQQPSLALSFRMVPTYDSYVEK